MAGLYNKRFRLWLALLSQSNLIRWIDGEVKPASEATVSVYDHGLLYGDGIFEGIRFYNKKAFRLDEHLNRLYDSSCVLGIGLPMSMEDISLAIKETMHAYQSCEINYLFYAKAGS